MELLKERVAFKTTRWNEKERFSTPTKDNAMTPETEIK